MKDLRYSQKILKIKSLRIFTEILMVSEANHYTVFLGFARQYQDRQIVDKKWDGLLAYEAEFMRNRGTDSQGSWLRMTN